MKYHLKLKSIKYRKSKYQIDKANNIYNRSLISRKVRSRRSSKYSNTRQVFKIVLTNLDYYFKWKVIYSDEEYIEKSN